MLDSKAVLAIIDEDGAFVICVRHNYRPELGMYSFYKWKQKFKTRFEAKKFAFETFPKCKLVLFDDLTKAE